MESSRSTCWTLIESAAAGHRAEQDAFVRRYSPVARAYLAARWRDHLLRSEIDDAVQEVFLECIREGGALGRVEPGRPGGFRAFLLGVVRNVALRAERRHARRRVRPAGSRLDGDRIPAEEDGVSTAFDRAWARSVLREAAEFLSRRAEEGGPEARRRVELLHLRFASGLPIRDIAARWEEDPARVHREYRRARAEYRDALTEIVAFHRPGATPADIDRECALLLDLI